MYIDTTLYDTEGNLLSGVYAWPKGRPQDQAYVMGNGELIMSGLNDTDIIVFSFQTQQKEIPANQIGSTLYLDFTEELDEVDLGTTTKPKKSRVGLFFGLLGLGLATAYVLSDDTQKVSI